LRVVIGRVARAHGVRGDLVIFSLTDEQESRFKTGNHVLLENGTDLEISAIASHSGSFIVHFKGIDDRNSAENLKGQDLLIEINENDRPANPESYFDRQLIGLKVKLLNGSDSGVIKDVLHPPAQDLLVLDHPEYGEVLIPFVKAIVPEVNLEQGFVVIDPPAGLLDLSQAEVADEN
jgi:16S rRNA processing protein RimM